MDEATLNVAQRVLAAYGSQRDDINDSDLDNEQPISLHVHLNLGDIRKLRMMVRMQGKNPADFRVRALKDGESVGELTTRVQGWPPAKSS